ncbi:DNA-3-methyladenine glycosylase [Candidatus Bathyarchaeota archaeon]|nr:DNA-3-methyladenine glycosylase [Candidatus Bathyarchaeota archaeon]
MLEVLPNEFYTRDPAPVGKDLSGKRLIRKLENNFPEGIIVETEAYYGLKLKPHLFSLWTFPPSKHGKPRITYHAV